MDVWGQAVCRGHVVGMKYLPYRLYVWQHIDYGALRGKNRPEHGFIKCHRHIDTAPRIETPVTSGCAARVCTMKRAISAVMSANVRTTVVRYIRGRAVIGRLLSPARWALPNTRSQNAVVTP